MVGEHTHGMDFQSRQDLRADTILSLLTLKPNRLIGVDGALTVGQQISGVCLPHRVKIQKDPATLGRYRFKCAVHLLVAVASHRSEDIASQAMGMNPDQDVLAVSDIALHESVM